MEHRAWPRPYFPTSPSSRGLARRLDDTNQALIELRRWVHAGQPRNVIEKTAEEMQELLGPSGVQLGYARYPYDLFALDRPNS
jgi:hypothetical protein